jgi:hypothetical protein
VKLPILAVVVALTTVLAPSTSSLRAETDLDAFMRQVLARRDDNWKKLQQYVLDEREQMELRGPNHQPIWGERREYTWYIREGFFIRSPVKFNGVEIGDAERRRYEAEYLRRSQARDARMRRQGSASGSSGGASADATPHVGETPPGPVQTPGGGAQTPHEAVQTPHGSVENQGEPIQAPAESVDDGRQGAAAGPTNVDGLLRQAREPQFVSSAYFLRFKFEDGKYAFVGRETLDGHEVMRVEYYPANLYSTAQQRRMARDHNPQDARDAEVQRMMNKVALVTLWIEPASHQIVKYTFDNIDFDFLPAQWLLRVDTVRATMTMGEPFPDTWLPRDIELKAAVDVAAGRFDIRWAVDYHDYRQADVKSKVHVGADR